MEWKEREREEGNEEGGEGRGKVGERGGEEVCTVQ